MPTATSTFAHGDIVQDRFGWFFRIVADGNATPLSVAGADVPARSIKSPTVLCHADGALTGKGDSMAARVAVVMARRYTR